MSRLAWAGSDPTRVEQPIPELETTHLRVLIATERKDRLALVAPIVVGLGHEVIARETTSPTWAP